MNLSPKKLLQQLAARYPYVDPVNPRDLTPEQIQAHRVRVSATIDRLRNMYRELESGNFDPFEVDLLNELKKIERRDVWSLKSWDEFLLLKGRHDFIREWTERLRGAPARIKQLEAQLGQKS